MSQFCVLRKFTFILKISEILQDMFYIVLFGIKWSFMCCVQLNNSNHLVGLVAESEFL